MQNSSCLQCGQTDQAKSVLAISQSSFTFNTNVDGRNLSGEGRSNLSSLFSPPKPFGQVQQIFLFVGALIFFPITVMFVLSIIAGSLINKKIIPLVKSFYETIPDNDFEFAQKRYNESLYCARCGIVYHPQSGIKQPIFQGFGEFEWKKYLYYGTGYGKTISGN